MTHVTARMLVLGAALACAAAVAGCTPPAPPPPRSSTWVMGKPEPRFDPDGPPDPTRWALERLLTRGLMEEDSSGRIIPAAAERVAMSADRLVYTFHLRHGLTYTDNSPCRSVDFQRALTAGLGRADHGTHAWLLQAVRGMDQVRPGKPLPPLGIEVPDDSTLVIRLARPDPLILRKLALPGIGDAWKDRSADSWRKAWGVGPYRPIRADSARRLTLLKFGSPVLPPPGAAVDTLHVRFLAGASRVRAALRDAGADLVWPLPPGLLAESLPSGYRSVAREARPPRRLLLVMRADLPPTSRLPTRHALAHSINRQMLLHELGPLARESSQWLTGAPPFDGPRLDGEEALRWMAAGKLGRSFHVDMAYDADGIAAEVARGMQGEWARLSIYVELIPLRGEALAEELLRGRAHLVLVDTQSLLSNPVADLAALVMPLRGPAVGSFRTGWRTRELDAWIAPLETPSPLPVAMLQRRLEEDRVVVPLAELFWMWVEPEKAPVGSFHPHFGPNGTGVGSIATANR